jgi:mono/diheme cytochrome c family protein
MWFGMVSVWLMGAGLWPVSYRQSEIEAGRDVYAARKCATCHMVAGKGNIRYPLDGVAARLTTDDLRRWLTDTAEMEGALPKQPAIRMSEWMDANRKISAHDLDALVAYLASLK